MFEQKRFLYRAEAMAFSATFPGRGLIAAQAPVALSYGGGYAEAARGSLAFAHEIAFTVESEGCVIRRAGVGLARFASVRSSVLAEPRIVNGHPIHYTLVTTEILDLDLFGVVRAERVFAKLESSHPGSGETPVDPFASTIQGLTVAGRPVVYDDMTPGFRENQRYAEIQYALVPNGRLAAAPRSAPSEFVQPCAVFANVRADGLRCAENSIRVEGFGTIYLGEYLLERHARRLVMLRVVLDEGRQALRAAVARGGEEPPDPPEPEPPGEIVVGFTSTNGHEYP